MTTHSKSTIRAVVFDLGKVLVDFDYGIAARKIAARAKMSVNELGVFILSAPVLLRYETGQLTTQQFYDAIRHGTGFSGSPEEFGATFADIFWPIPSMV